MGLRDAERARAEARAELEVREARLVQAQEVLDHEKRRVAEARTRITAEHGEKGNEALRV